MTQPDRSAVHARNLLLAMFVLLCLLDVALVVIARDRWAIGRILPTIVVMYFVIQGRKWAKWLLIGICSSLVVVLIAMMVALASRLSTLLLVGSAILAFLSATIAIYLASNKDLNRYFSAQRQANSP
jgi:O-antigen ligase